VHTLRSPERGYTQGYTSQRGSEREIYPGLYLPERVLRGRYTQVYTSQRGSERGYSLFYTSQRGPERGFIPVLYLPEGS